MTRGTAGSSPDTITINSTGIYIWYSSELYPEGSGDATILSGAYSFTLHYCALGSPIPNGTITFTAQVGLADDDGTGYSQFGESASYTTLGFCPLETTRTICADCEEQTITEASPKRLVLRLNVTAVSGSGIYLRLEDSHPSDSRLSTPVVTVPEAAVALLPAALMIPMLACAARRSKAARTGRRTRNRQAG
jgi:hypothetical protein